MSYVPRKLFLNRKYVNRAIFSHIPPLYKASYVPTTKNYVPVTVKYLTGSVIIVVIIAMAADNASVLPVIIGLKTMSFLIVKLVTLS